VFVKKIDQNSTRPNFFVKCNTQLVQWKKVAPKIWADSATAHNKQSPNWRKFAQSGHPVETTILQLLLQILSFAELGQWQS
jgi:hypothetical protein